jgi:hypothetical protein
MLRYSLRTLLIVVAALSLPLVYFDRVRRSIAPRPGR